MKFQRVQFIKSVHHLNDLPSLNYPEIAVAGRSNVGKSSLLNHFFRAKNLVKTSSTPGKTRALNFFQSDENIMFVDMPGYGYAAVEKSQRKLWSELVENYLNNRENLKILLFLIDSRREPQSQDIQLYEWIQWRKLPAILILTKVDKLNQSQKSSQTRRITDRIKGLPYVHYSATKNEGRKELIAHVETFLNGSA